MQPDKQQIRKNRDKFRLSLKACFVIPSQKVNTIDLKKAQQQNSPMKKIKRRKTSEDIRIYDEVGYLKQIYVSNSFSDLFQKTEQLGQGAQSVVHKCIERDTGNVYAVKKIQSRQPQMIKRQKEQYRILKSLDNDSIIKAYYLFINEVEGTIHLVSQYCNYPTLDKVIKAKQRLKEVQVCEILSLIINALIYMHQNNICHRDIKPSNILYDQVTGSLKIIDFQISKMSKYNHQKLDMWTKTGTIYYQAPEMLTGSYNQLIDIWALGVMCYEMLTGHLPFTSQFSKDLATKIIQQQPNYEQENSLTELSKDFLKRVLKKNPIQRLNARQALQTPFILKYSSYSSASSPSPLVKQNSNEDKKQKELWLDNKFCYDEDSQINGISSFSQDIGIRFQQND